MVIYTLNQCILAWLLILTIRVDMHSHGITDNLFILNVHVKGNTARTPQNGGVTSPKYVSKPTGLKSAPTPGRNFASGLACPYRHRFPGGIGLLTARKFYLGNIYVKPAQ